MFAQRIYDAKLVFRNGGLSTHRESEHMQKNPRAHTSTIQIEIQTHSQCHKVTFNWRKYCIFEIIAEIWMYLL